MPDAKTCTKCREVKPLTDFGVRRKARDGREYRCLMCIAQYREENREALRAHQAKYRTKNRETIRARHAEYENRQDVKSRKAKYRADNRDAERARAKQWYEENRAAARVRMEKYAATVQGTAAAATAQRNRKLKQLREALS
jgi:hypothetical protein